MIGSISCLSCGPCSSRNVDSELWGMCKAGQPHCSGRLVSVVSPVSVRPDRPLEVVICISRVAVGPATPGASGAPGARIGATGCVPAGMIGRPQPSQPAGTVVQLGLSEMCGRRRPPSGSWGGTTHRSAETRKKSAIVLTHPAIRVETLLSRSSYKGQPERQRR